MDHFLGMCSTSFDTTVRTFSTHCSDVMEVRAALQVKVCLSRSNLVFRWHQFVYGQHRSCLFSLHMATTAEHAGFTAVACIMLLHGPCSWHLMLSVEPRPLRRYVPLTALRIWAAQSLTVRSTGIGDFFFLKKCLPAGVACL